MRKFRKRAAEVDAEQITEKNAYQLAVDNHLNYLRTGSGMQTIEAANRHATVGDWLARDGDRVFAYTDDEMRQRYVVPEKAE